MVAGFLFVDEVSAGYTHNDDGDDGVAQSLWNKSALFDIHIYVYSIDDPSSWRQAHDDDDDDDDEISPMGWGG